MVQNELRFSYRLVQSLSLVVVVLGTTPGLLLLYWSASPVIAIFVALIIASAMTGLGALLPQMTVWLWWRRQHGRALLAGLATGAVWLVNGINFLASLALLSALLADLHTAPMIILQALPQTGMVGLVWAVLFAACGVMVWASSGAREGQGLPLLLPGTW